MQPAPLVNGSAGQFGELVAIDTLSGATSAFNPIADNVSNESRRLKRTRGCDGGFLGD